MIAVQFTGNVVLLFLFLVIGGMVVAVFLVVVMVNFQCGVVIYGFPYFFFQPHIRQLNHLHQLHGLLRGNLFLRELLLLS